MGANADVNVSRESAVEDVSVGVIGVLIVMIACIALYYLYWKFYRVPDPETDEMDGGGVIRVGEINDENQNAPLLQEKDHASDHSDGYMDLESEDQTKVGNSAVDTVSSYVSFSGYGVFGSSSDRNQPYLAYAKL